MTQHLHLWILSYIHITHLFTLKQSLQMWTMPEYTLTDIYSGYSKLE
jgi:hypothetical protein